MKKHIISLLVLFLMVSTSFIGVSNHDIVDTDKSETQNDGGLMNSPWSMKCHDLHHTGLSPYSTTETSDVEKWQFKTGGWIEDSVVIADDRTIYVASSDFKLYALYPNGTLKWKYAGFEDSISSAPAIAEDGVIYATSYDHSLQAIYPNGTSKWKFYVDDMISSSPVISNDGTVYFGEMGPGNYGRIYAVNPNGTEKWYYDTGYWIVSDPAIGDDGTIYIGSGDTYLYALYPDGTLRWRFKTEDYVNSPPSIASDGTIYIGSFDGYLYALYPNNGTMKWGCGIGPGTNTNPSIANDGTIYIGGDKLYAIYPDGTLKWGFDLGDDKWIGDSSPAISADGTIYIGTHISESSGGELLAVNPNGIERWRKIIATKWVDSSPSIDKDGTVYIGTSSEEEVGPGQYKYVGYLYAFGPLDLNAPTEPVITGPETGKVGVKYDYTFTSTSPIGNEVYYYIEWGDGSSTNWFGPVPSGVSLTMNHSWSKKDSYTIKARAKDTDNNWGPWGELEVTMPYSYEPQFPFIHWLLGRFPNALPILRFLLEFNH